MRRVRFLALYFLAWLPLAALYVVAIYLQSPDRSALGALIGGSETVAFAALLGLLAWKFARRLAESGWRLHRLIGAHFGLAIVYGVAWTALVLASIALLAPPGVFDAFVHYAVVWQMVSGLIIYGIVAGIAHAFYVTRRLRRERDAAARAEALRVRAELSALRAQMNPHFLFNTLHSIAALVRSDPRAVENALERLAALLRRLLDVNRSGTDQIALAEEWEIVRDQLELEKLRFGSRLHVIEDLESDALECAVPVFTVQPLVENAIRHAIAVRTQGGTITVRARALDDQLVIEVLDDGPGAEPRAVHAAPGLGLSAVRQRLAALYGDRAGVRIDTGVGRGFSVRVALPASPYSVALPAPASRPTPMSV
jgi:two-component sensor histidine kinase